MSESTRPEKSTNVRAPWRRELRRRKRAALRALTIGTIGASVGTLAQVAPWAALDVASFLFFKPQRTPVHGSEAALLAAAKPLDICLRRRTLRGWSWGPEEAPPVLLVHGWSGRAGQLCAFVEPLLERGHRVVAFDLRGHGDSTGHQATIVGLAEDVLAIGGHVGPLDGVVAHSFGGPVTTLALLAGLRADRAVFIAPPFDAAAWLGRFSSIMGFDDTMRGRLRRQLESTVGLGFDELSARFLAPNMNKPLLVIHDENDREVAVDDGERLAAHWPGARLMRTKGLGHQRILRDDHVVAAALQFLGQSPPSSRNRQPRTSADTA